MIKSSGDRKMKIGKIDTKKQVALVAEIGNNHEGSFSLAEELIGLAHEAGANAVKFQYYNLDLYVDKSNLERREQLKKYALSDFEVEKLFSFANERGIHLFATPFDLDSASVLSRYAKTFKIASGDITYTQLIEYISKLGRDLIISTGASSFDEVEMVINLIEGIWKLNSKEPDLAILHCVSAYPAKSNALNLRVIGEFKKRFPNHTIGFSDHTVGIESALRAVAAGAYIVEKHFTINKEYSNFRDHALSCDFKELKELRNKISELEEELGNGVKGAHESEISNKKIIRRSFAAAQNLHKGQVISVENLICLRPESGIPSNDLKSVENKTLIRNLYKGEIIQSSDLI
jgi:sialic acid synthase SpsE